VFGVTKEVGSGERALGEIGLCSSLPHQNFAIETQEHLGCLTDILERLVRARKTECDKPYCPARRIMA
jgi:hypothetical protein